MIRTIFEKQINILIKYKFSVKGSWDNCFVPSNAKMF